MRSLILFLLLAFAASEAQAGLRGRLDLSLDTDAIGLRELNDGNWLAGLQKRVFYLEKDGREVLHLSVFSAWRTNHGDPAYGPSLGLGAGSLGQYLADLVNRTAPDLYQSVKWVPKLADFVSVEVFTGYRPNHGPDTHDLIYGFGGKVKIPLDLLKGL